jgi:hypothetical protein
MTMKTKTTLTLLASLSLLSVLGCDDKASFKEFFPNGERKTDQMIDAQTAAGARADATLHDFHFTGGKLNSLGEEKLDMMVPQQADQDLVVYVDLPKDDGNDARKTAVSDYLHYRGMDATHVKLVDGPNPGTRALSAEGLARISKTETSDTDSDNAASNTSGSAGSATAAH